MDSHGGYRSSPYKECVKHEWKAFLFANIQICFVTLEAAWICLHTAVYWIQRDSPLAQLLQVASAERHVHLQDFDAVVEPHEHRLFLTGAVCRCIAGVLRFCVDLLNISAGFIIEQLLVPGLWPWEPFLSRGQGSAADRFIHKSGYGLVCCVYGSWNVIVKADLIFSSLCSRGEVWFLAGLAQTVSALCEALAGRRTHQLNGPRRSGGVQPVQIWGQTGCEIWRENDGTLCGFRWGHDGWVWLPRLKKVWRGAALQKVLLKRDSVWTGAELLLIYFRLQVSSGGLIRFVFRQQRDDLLHIRRGLDRSVSSGVWECRCRLFSNAGGFCNHNDIELIRRRSHRPERRTRRIRSAT